MGGVGALVVGVQCKLVLSACVNVLLAAIIFAISHHSLDYYGPKNILTSQQHAKHPLVGQNMQQFLIEYFRTNIF